MPTEAAERRAGRVQQIGAPLPPGDLQDPLPCPRCSSANTKFCYYNNYNFSQPRHFCKSCRRYWTHGGTLRDIPVGGGSRKTAKRSRTSCATFSAPPTPSTSSGVSAGSIIEPMSVSQGPVCVSLPFGGSGGGGLTSLLSGGGGSGGILALGGFGLGLGLEEVGFGLGRGVWAFPHHEVGSYVNGDVGNCGGGGGLGAGDGGSEGRGEGGVTRSDTWQMASGEVVGFIGADCGFPSLPELAISSSGNGLK